MNFFEKFSCVPLFFLSRTTKSSEQREQSLLKIDISTLLKGFFCGLLVYAVHKTLPLLSDALKTLDDSKSVESRKALAKRLKRPEVEFLDFSSYEVRLLNDVLGCDEIDVSFTDVGGLQNEIDEIYDNVILPIQLHQQPGVWKGGGEELFSSLRSPSGVLLYGLPGTGKTLLAKAIAKECGATFLNIKASALLDKWFGESDRLVSALFSLARKLSPSLIFIDEIESLLRKRGDEMRHNPAMISLQGVFLSEWDGLLSNTSSFTSTTSVAEGDAKAFGPVMVVGATNRPTDIDTAFLRRMPVQIQTKMPDCAARLSIFHTLVRKEKLSEDVNLEELAELTRGFSGSDLKELVRLSQLRRFRNVKSLLKKSLSSSSSSPSSDPPSVTPHLLKNTATDPLTHSDLLFAFDKMRNTSSNLHHFHADMKK